jgi:cyclophilin family peptidyl-prolyl cis-trans isomerase
MVLTTPIVSRRGGGRRRRRRGVNNNPSVPKELRPVELTREEILKNLETKTNIENRKNERLEKLKNVSKECNNAMNDVNSGSKEFEDSISIALEKLDIAKQEREQMYQTIIKQSTSVAKERRKSVGEELSDMRVRARTRSQERLNFILMKNGIDVDIPFPFSDDDFDSKCNLISLDNLLDPFAGESLAYPDNDTTSWVEMGTLIDPFLDESKPQTSESDAIIPHPNDVPIVSSDEMYDLTTAFDPYSSDKYSDTFNTNGYTIPYPETNVDKTYSMLSNSLEDPYDGKSNNNNDDEDDKIPYPGINSMAKLNNRDLFDAYDDDTSTTKATESKIIYATPKDRLVAFYSAVLPANLPKVDKNLKKYAGREEVLWGLLHRKYKEKFVPFAPAEMLVKRKDIKYGKKDNKKVFFEIAIDRKAMEKKIIIQLFDHIVPNTCENFRALCTGEKGVGTKGKPLHYKNCIIHRIIKDFMIQGGDITNGNGTGGECIYVGDSTLTNSHGKFIDENFKCRHVRRGMLSMANAGPNSNTSQFFITLSETPHLDMKHVVFGEVVEGMDMIIQLGDLGTGMGNKPNQDVRIINCGEI